MKIETSWNSCEFVPENEDDKELLTSLYDSLSDPVDKNKYVYIEPDQSRMMIIIHEKLYESP